VEDAEDAEDVVMEGNEELGWQSMRFERSLEVQ
jgi:hypothetical protein